MKLKGIFSEISEDFPTLSNQLRDVQEIVSFHCQLSWSDLHIKQDAQLAAEDIEKIWKDLLRLRKGEPCAYILGEKAFYKFNFLVKPGVLIPRPETELLVERATQLKTKPMRFADLGAGTGCIGLSLAREWPDSKGVLIENSRDALAVCRANQFALGVKNIEIVAAEVDADRPTGFGLFDLVVANPPYIAKGDLRVQDSVHIYEPHPALFAADQGLKFIQNWMSWSERSLKPGGQYIFEFGQNQETQIEELITQTKFKIVDCLADYQKIPRFFHLQKSAE